jgi:hypothetical protein
MGHARRGKRGRGEVGKGAKKAEKSRNGVGRVTTKRAKRTRAADTVKIFGVEARLVGKILGGGVYEIPLDLKRVN